MRFLGFVPEPDLPAAVRERDGVRLPEPRRGLRDARRRGDGLRVAGRDEPRHGDGGDRWRRGRARRRRRRRVDPRSASSPPSTTRRRSPRAGAPAPPSSAGTRPPRRRWPHTARLPDERQLDVAVNLLWLAPGRVGGSEQYLVRQLAGLPPDSGIAPRLMCQRAFVDRPSRPCRPLPDRGRAARPRLARRRGSSPSTHGSRARSRNADVVHHGGGTVPVAGPRPILLTIHDLQYLAFPDYFSTARRTYLRWMVPRSVQAGGGRRRAVGVRARDRHRRLPCRRRSRRRRAARRSRCDDRRRCRDRGGPRPLRSGFPAVSRVSGDHASAQGSRRADRDDGGARR